LCRCRDSLFKGTGQGDEGGGRSTERAAESLAGGIPPSVSPPLGERNGNSGLKSLKGGKESNYERFTEKSHIKVKVEGNLPAAFKNKQRVLIAY